MTADDGLISRLIGRDQAALASLYDAYGSTLYHAALRIVGDPGTAEEVMQDSFFQLWRKATQFDSERGSLIGWLLTITRHRAISRLRRDGTGLRLDRLSDDEDSQGRDICSSPLERQIASELVSAALVGLSDAQREVLTLAYLEGMTCHEIAAQTGTPLGTVKGRLRSATTKVRQALSGPKRGASRKPVQEPARLCDILITDQLAKRAIRQRDPQQERRAIKTMGLAAASGSQQLLDAFLQMPIELCNAGTTGISLLETDAGGQRVFRWTNLAGRLQKYVGGTTPRDFSPCGVTLDRNAAQLFARPARYFHYFDDVPVPIVEGLVIPFHVRAKTEGTVWIVSHREGTRFDSEDARIMTVLTEFAACALYVESRLEDRDREG